VNSIGPKNDTSAKKKDGPCSGGGTWKENQALSKTVEKYSDASHWTEEEVLIRFEAWMLFVIDRATANLPKHYKANIKNDIDQEARIALLLCWRDYQKKKALCKFTTFSFLRIRGAVIDFFRERRTSDTPFPKIVSVDFSCLLNDEEEAISRAVLGDTIVTTDLLIDLCNALFALDPWERKLISLHYTKDSTLKEIGALADVTEGRACQVHADVIEKLRLSMDHS